MEGKFRPGHFRGVCQVVDKLLNIVDPRFLFLGQKDFQQCLVIKRLLALTNKRIEIIVCPTLREKNALQKAAENLRLNPDEIKIAPILNQVLLSIKNKLAKNNFPKLKLASIFHLEKAGFKVEYLELARRSDLKILTEFKKGQEYVILVAAFLNEVRLIDNLIIEG